MVVVQYGLHRHLGRVSKQLVAIQTVLIDWDVTIQSQLEDIGKQIQLLVDGLHRIIQSGIGIFVEVQLTIDIAAPYDVLRHIYCRRKRQAGTHRHTLILRLLTFLLLGSLLLLLSTRLRLSTDWRNEK